MPATYCPHCDGLTRPDARRCPSCDGERPVEGWPEDLLIGKPFLESYTVIERLGSGGFGVVYLAENAEFGARRAIKVLDERHVHDDNVLRRFKREAKALYQLQSPYTVRVERWGRTRDGHYYLVMEFAEGQTLREILESSGRLDEHRALSIARQTAVALADAHALGILHRDLKPENLVIRRHPHEGDRVAVLDFGISKILSDETATQRSGLVGTPAYLAPECWNPTLGPQDIRADLWSLGVICFEMLAGRLPWDDGESSGSSPMTTAYQVTHLEPLRVAAGLEELSLGPHTRAIVQRLLRHRPVERFATPGEVVEAIERHPLWTGRAGGKEAAPRDEPPAPTGRPGTSAHEGSLETADTVPSLPRRGGRRDEPSGEGPTLMGPEDDAPAEPVLSFQDEPPESLRLGRSDAPAEPDEERRGPSVGIVLVAVALLAMLAGIVWIGERLFGLSVPQGRDAGLLVGADAGLSGGGTGSGLADGDHGERVEGRDGMPALLVPGGTFQMGVDTPASTTPAHTVWLSPFYIDEHEVTARMWLDCVQTRGCRDDEALGQAQQPGCRRLDGGDGDAAEPLNCVSWEGAQDYCRTYGRRLPTEAEWERAARAASAQPGQPAGQAGDALDLTGGPSEWVSDWYSSDYYDVSPTLDPQGPVAGWQRVVRDPGGDHADPVTARRAADPSEQRADRSFRCAAAAP